MHSLSMAIIALMALILLPALTIANTTEGTELEEPKILPLTDAKISDVNEIWQEDPHEVVIRKQRGAKENGSGTTTGKKKERKDKNGSTTTTQVPKLNKNSDTNMETNTQEPTIGKKHKHHQSKHDKSNKKSHTSTIKPELDGNFSNGKSFSSFQIYSTEIKMKTFSSLSTPIDSCRYTKGTWSECDIKTNSRSKTLTLKKGDATCVQTRIIQRKCKKGKSDKGEKV